LLVGFVDAYLSGILETTKKTNPTQNEQINQPEPEQTIFSF
jgi:hypothetical protein